MLRTEPRLILKAASEVVAPRRTGTRNIRDVVKALAALAMLAPLVYSQARTGASIEEGIEIRQSSKPTVPSANSYTLYVDAVDGHPKLMSSLGNPIAVIVY